MLVGKLVPRKATEVYMSEGSRSRVFCTVRDARILASRTLGSTRLPVGAYVYACHHATVDVLRSYDPPCKEP